MRKKNAAAVLKKKQQQQHNHPASSSCHKIEHQGNCVAGAICWEDTCVVTAVAFAFAWVAKKARRRGNARARNAFLAFVFFSHLLMRIHLHHHHHPSSVHLRLPLSSASTSSCLSLILSISVLATVNITDHHNLPRPEDILSGNKKGMGSNDEDTKGKNLPPLIFIPGLTSSTIDAELHNAPSVEHAYETNGQRKVTLLAVSYGPQFALSFLHRQSQAWKDKYIHWFIAESPVWSGAPATVLAVTSGYDTTSPNALLFTRQVSIETASDFWLFPRAGATNSTWGEPTLNEAGDVAYPHFHATTTYH
ncbi:hypothetical protein PTSG_10636 [Salpingoeca rosetta]|uniref:Uncharacterized protein n=1 Tax=Salpingoeca rosetta (strain ATCC 50818 / BSB-021) TaxID=946362 RepID=F2URX9_SALR5|nr:uncharacterized protein PTSG_10636 [Salpingoeca rosetta]EGD80384.1 hypothetical protein PTSG_10636 [Salpingoeca rosetta]|eukprot:XP_004988174.1 hypothetical protein PTSG_10636 [Salpingoeca rosetta]